MRVLNCYNLSALRNCDGKAHFYCFQILAASELTDADSRKLWAVKWTRLTIVDTRQFLNSSQSTCSSQIPSFSSFSQPIAFAWSSKERAVIRKFTYSVFLSYPLLFLQSVWSVKRTLLLLFLGSFATRAFNRHYTSGVPLRHLLATVISFVAISGKDGCDGLIETNVFFFYLVLPFHLILIVLQLPRRWWQALLSLALGAGSNLSRGVSNALVHPYLLLLKREG